MTFDERQSERAAKGETVFAGTWCPTGEGLYLVSATTIDDFKSRVVELEQWVAAIADEHPQIPDWIQQSARSLLAERRDSFIAGMTYPKVVVTDDKGNVRLQTDDFGNVSIGTVQERIKLLEQRIIDLQGHDNLSYIDKRLSEQEGE